MPIIHINVAEEFHTFITQMSRIPQSHEKIQIVLSLPQSSLLFATAFDPLKYALKTGPMVQIAQTLASGACPENLHLRIETDFTDLGRMRPLTNALAYCAQNFTLDLKNTKSLPMPILLNNTRQIATEFGDVLKNSRYQRGLSLHLQGVLECYGDVSHSAPIIFDAFEAIPIPELARMQIKAVTTGMIRIDQLIANKIQVAKEWMIQYELFVNHPMLEEAGRTAIQTQEMQIRQLLRRNFNTRLEMTEWENLDEWVRI